MGVNAAVRMADFLYVVGACREAGNGNLTTGIGGIGTGYQRGAGAVAVNAELPSGQVFAILRSLGQTQVASIQGVVEADRSLPP